LAVNLGSHEGFPGRLHYNLGGDPVDAKGTTEDYLTHPSPIPAQIMAQMPLFSGVVKVTCELSRQCPHRRSDSGPPAATRGRRFNADASLDEADYRPRQRLFPSRPAFRNGAVQRRQQSLDLAVVGNGRTLALVNPLARIVWWCFPRYDGDPVFCRLISGDEDKGFTDVVLDGLVSSDSEYVRNTALVTTVLTDRQGNAVRITDFAPRFEQFGRTFRPPQLMRLIEPLAGLPRITIRFRPTSGHGQRNMVRAFGSNHIRYTSDDLAIRLTTDAPLAYIDRESPFVLTRPVSLVFGADTPFEGDLATTCCEFGDRTRDHWQEWVRRMSISYSLPVGREGRLLLCTRTRAETGDRAASSRTRGLTQAPTLADLVSRHKRRE